jgi:endoglucanase
MKALVIALVLVLVAAATAAAVIDTSAGGSGSRRGSIATDAAGAARAFLRAYVEPSGRVVRRDQGDDTVSEGQAYALLLAESVGEWRVFGRVWAWSRAHLMHRDGELSYRASPAGVVEDREPSSDADVLAAWALSRARGPDAAGYHAQAGRLSAAILGNETVARGRLRVLAAGPWATGSPASLDPSYWAPPAFAQLGRATGARGWRRLGASARAVTTSLTRGGTVLPPDWARLDGEVASDTPAPNREAPQVRYGLDAQRLVVWLASSCTPADRRLAARWWPILARGEHARALALTPTGTVLDGATNALPYVAGAAAAGAAGDAGARSSLLAEARQVQSRYPTYYGGAWLALGETLLGTHRLGGCADQGGGK